MDGSRSEFEIACSRVERKHLLTLAKRLLHAITADEVRLDLVTQKKAIRGDLVRERFDDSDEISVIVIPAPTPIVTTRRIQNIFLHVFRRIHEVLKAVPCTLKICNSKLCTRYACSGLLK